MLLQRQYSLLRQINILIAIGIVLMLLGGIYFKWKAYSLEKEINKEYVKKNDIDKKAFTIVKQPLYVKYNLAGRVLEQDNINYAGLYEYLRKIRDDIAKTLRKNALNKFDLSISKGEVAIKLLLPNYNILYEGEKPIVDKLVEQNFIKKMSISSYRKFDGAILTTIKIKTNK